ncbi:MAG: hypothetical protein PHE79_05080 [Eubacteriales bacterium]|nr:hypothetical protein [Eubacteriales bacterium]
MFIFNRSLSGENFQTIRELPTTAQETYVAGEGLVVTTGALTKVGATAKPEYIAAANYVAPVEGQKELPVYPVLPHHEYETTFAADASAVTEGSKVTIHTDGAQITATGTNGVATIVRKLGTGAEGTKALVRFI